MNLIVIIISILIYSLIIKNTKIEAMSSSSKKEIPKTVIYEEGICPDNWDYNGKSCKNSCREVHFTNYTDKQKKKWALDNNVPWKKYGIVRDMLCPEVWKLSDDGVCREPSGIGGHVKFSEKTTDLAKQKWAMDNQVPWEYYKVEEDVICPDEWERRADGYCFDPKGNRTSRFNSSHCNDYKREFAFNKQTPWVRYGVTKEHLCPTDWNLVADLWCQHPRDKHTAVQFNSSHDRRKWALKNGVIWKAYDVNKEDLCPDDFSLQPDGWCLHEKGVLGTFKLNEQSDFDIDRNKEFWALDNNTPWEKFNVPKERLCPDGWILKYNGDCIDPTYTFRGIRFSAKFDDECRRKWANKRGIKWTYVGAE